MSSCACLTNQKKMYISIQTALIGFVIFNPVLFQLVRGILGGWIASADGCPTLMGSVVHTVVFAVVLYFLMKPKKGDGSAIKTQSQTLPGLPLQ